MPLTPLDIHNKEFRRSFRGYNPDEVDDFLDEVIKEFELLIRENKELKAQVNDLTEKLNGYKDIEATLKETLVLAQGMADQIKANARKEADLIIKESEIESEKLKRAAREKVRELTEKYYDLKRQIEAFRVRFKGMIQAQLELMDKQTQELEEIGPSIDLENEVPSEDLEQAKTMEGSIKTNTM